MRPRRSIRIEVIAAVGLLVAALLTEPWLTLVGITVIYLALIPVGIFSYMKLKRRREANAAQGRDA
jgi:CDP-diacylglycerol--serine O-phosphatidyltransferase